MALFGRTYYCPDCKLADKVTPLKTTNQVDGCYAYRCWRCRTDFLVNLKHNFAELEIRRLTDEVGAFTLK